MISHLSAGGASAMRDAMDQDEGTAVVGGVRWIGGVPAADRTLRTGPRSDRAETTVVIGRAHGPRLLELLCAAG